MSLLMKERVTCCGQGPSSYAPIVQALTTLSDYEKAIHKRKFDIAYLVEKLTSKPLSQWATYSTTCAKFGKEASGSADTSEYYY